MIALVNSASNLYRRKQHRKEKLRSRKLPPSHMFCMESRFRLLKNQGFVVTLRTFQALKDLGVVHSAATSNRLCFVIRTLENGTVFCRPANRVYQTTFLSSYSSGVTSFAGVDWQQIVSAVVFPGPLALPDGLLGVNPSSFAWQLSHHRSKACW